MDLGESYKSLKRFLKENFENAGSTIREDEFDTNLYGSLSRCKSVEEAAETLREHSSDLKNQKKRGEVGIDYSLPVHLEDLYAEDWEALKKDFRRKHMSHIISSAMITTPH
tara:strand:- start:310 stop:642 length:333 start_codon:yes stop_codon:yes gene_type:complete